MPFARSRPGLEVPETDWRELRQISRSRNEAHGRVARAQILLRYHAGESVSQIARDLELDRVRVDRTVAKALAIGALAALDELPRSGRPTTIPEDARP